MSEIGLSVVWFRRDLRTKDHRTLFEACRASKEVIGLFVFDTTILGRLENADDRRISFILDSVLELRSAFRDRGGELVILYGDPVEEVPRFASQLKAKAVFCSIDFEPQAKHRDLRVSKALQSEGISFFSYKDQVVFGGREILNQESKPFRVFTPYRRAWLNELARDPQVIRCYNADLSKLARPKELKPYTRDWDLAELGFRRQKLWLTAGEKAGFAQLKTFSKKISDYKQNRDYPALDGTSGLSTHLRFGTISLRSCVRMTYKIQTEGAQTWQSELIWREFYQMILDQFPHVAKGSFKPEYQNVKWPGTREYFNRWCEGSTGYPLVDAAMRHFNSTGWMHNRLRMVTAMFLVKDLLCDYRWGETYFAKHLLDFELASNNGGWQWCAGTGCDAQPYFRVFNPMTQSEKFDADGTFIREHLPELRHLKSEQIHAPWEAGSPVPGYPAPVVQHSGQRVVFIDLFKKVRDEQR